MHGASSILRQYSTRDRIFARYIGVCLTVSAGTTSKGEGAFGPANRCLVPARHLPSWCGHAIGCLVPARHYIPCTGPLSSSGNPIVPARHRLSCTGPHLTICCVSSGRVPFMFCDPVRGDSPSESVAHNIHY